MKLTPEFHELNDDDIGELIRIGQRQARFIDELQVALESGDEVRALELARQVAGLEKEIGK